MCITCTKYCGSSRKERAAFDPNHRKPVGVISWSFVIVMINGLILFHTMSWICAVLLEVFKEPADSPYATQIKVLSCFRAILTVVWNLNEQLKNWTGYRYLLFFHLFLFHTCPMIAKNSKQSNKNDKAQNSDPGFLKESTNVRNTSEEHQEAHNFRSIDSKTNILSIMNTCFKLKIRHSIIFR